MHTVRRLSKSVLQARFKKRGRDELWRGLGSADEMGFITCSQVSAYSTTEFTGRFYQSVTYQATANEMMTLSNVIVLGQQKQ